MNAEMTPAGSLEDVATGQRLMILAIVVNIIAYIMSRAAGPMVGLLVGIVGVIVAIVGMVRATGGLGYSTPRRVLYVIGLFIPVIALIVLAMVSAEATKTLKANGYQVGFFGAKK